MSDDEAIPDIDEAIPDIDEDTIPDDIKDDKEEEFSDLDDTDIKKTSEAHKNPLSDNDEVFSSENDEEEPKGERYFPR